MCVLWGVGQLCAAVTFVVGHGRDVCCGVWELLERCVSWGWVGPGSEGWACVGLVQWGGAVPDLTAPGLPVVGGQGRAWVGVRVRLIDAHCSATTLLTCCLSHLSTHSPSTLLISPPTLPPLSSHPPLHCTTPCTNTLALPGHTAPSLQPHSSHAPPPSPPPAPPPAPAPPARPPCHPPCSHINTCRLAEHRQQAPPPPLVATVGVGGLATLPDGRVALQPSGELVLPRSLLML